MWAVRRVKQVRWRIWLGALVVAIVGVLLQIRWSPANHKVHIDGTVFAYGGARVLEGDLPYRDFWDHKPPGVYYLDALSFLLLGTDAWALWYLAVAWTLAIAGCFLAFLRRLMPTAPATLMTIVLSATALQPRLYQGTNLTEFYGLLPAVLSLLLTHSYLIRRRQATQVALGLTLAASLFLKHTNVGTPLACLIFMTYLDFTKGGFSVSLRSLLRLVGPTAVSVLTAALYWSARGSLLDLWQATVEYNLLYVGSAWGPSAVYGALREIVVDPTLGPLFVLSLGAAMKHLSTIRNRQLRIAAGNSERSSYELAYMVCFLALGFEILMISLGTRGFGHYFISIVPALCASASYWFWRSRAGDVDVAGSRANTLPSTLATAGLIVWLLAIFGLVRPTRDQIRSFMLDAPIRRPLRTDLGKFIVEQTDPDDTVLVWGPGAEINFETGRRAPSRYVYYQPLFRRGFQNQQRWQEFLADLATEPPALIVAQEESGFAPMFDVPAAELAAQCGCEGAVLEGFTEFSRFVQAHYRRELMFDGAFAVYFREPP